MSQGRGGAYGAAIAALAVGPSTWKTGPLERHLKPVIPLYSSIDSSSHDVEVVDYTGCQASTNAKVHSSGNDRIKLVHGANYFICGFEGHCENGMKIAVNAA